MDPNHSQRRPILKSSRPGFSLIEALVVLAISGMALAVIFTIGTKAGDTGFGLGRRAMAASESDISISDLRTLIRSVALRPPATFSALTDKAVVGSTDRFESDIVMERANQCGPAGWAGRMILMIESVGDRNQLVCETGGRKTVLLDLGSATAVFAYSQDGRSWSTSYTNRPRDGADATNVKSETVWVRLASPTIGDVIEVAESGSPQAWVRMDGTL